jgi:dienelactone hydrolase
MAITFSCEGCGKSYTVRDEFAGKTGQCKQCGQRMTIPSESDSDGYGLDVEPEGAAGPEPSSLPPRRGMGAPASQSSPPRRPLFDSSGSSSSSSDSSMRNTLGGLFGVLIVVAGIGLRAYNGWNRAQNRNNQNAQANAFAPQNGGGGAPNFNPVLPVNTNGPIALPFFPEPGPGREIEPGITLHEINLGPPGLPASTPGHSGKLWLYLPSGDHLAKSLPCVLITGAGSTLLTGMGLADEDRVEHLPYVRAGFAVLAFELDGSLQNRESATNQQKGEAMFRFLAARAGLVNANVALEYALKKVPEVDPKRISAAGHSSAAVLAVLFAENEPRLRACVAFAPALDIEKRFGPQAVAQLKRAGVGDLVVRYSPKTNENNLKCPLFLFHARDDSNVPVEDSESFANRLNARGKSVTLDVVPSGEHYDSMINEGIPHAIAWLKEQGAGPNP